MSWEQNSYPYSWHKGSGINRTDITGPCPWVLGNGASHVKEVMTYNTFLGIPYDKQKIYYEVQWPGASQVGEPPHAGELLTPAVDASVDPERYYQCWREADNPPVIEDIEVEDTAIKGTQNFASAPNKFLIYLIGAVVCLGIILYLQFTK